MRFAIAALMITCVTLAGIAPGRGQQPQPKAPHTHSASLTADQLYQGWRASRVLGQDVISKSGGRKLGTVRNLTISDHGQIESVVVEGSGPTEMREFIYRIPWQRIDAAKLPGKVTADIASSRQPEYGLFPGQSSLPETPSTFAVSRVLGDYARLQAGQGYGYVSDVVFGRSGRMLAVLVTRDALAGGGTIAFAFPGSTGRWDARMSYYGLPYVTAEQANKGGIQVDSKLFNNGGAG